MNNFLGVKLMLFVMLLSVAAKAQYTWWDILYCLNGGEIRTATIQRMTEANPIGKPGWQLVFHDEFESNSLSTSYWNRSTPWDDGIGECVRSFSVSPENVNQDEGIARVMNTAMSSIPDCSYSGGEIKSFSVKDTSFQSYYFYAPGFLETRVRLFNKPGQGAACWLWGIGTASDPGGSGPWSEIDIFETNGTDPNKFNGTYHWTHKGNHVSQNYKVSLNDSSGACDLTSGWTIFGLEWDSLSIKWYVNNTLIKELEFDRIPPYCIGASQYSWPDAPYSIRFSSGRNTVGNQGVTANPADLPQSMMVDYIRVYQRSGTKVCPIKTGDNENQVCIDTLPGPTSKKRIRTHYYPDYQYSWSSEAFQLTPVLRQLPQQASQQYVLSVKENILPGFEYPLRLMSHSNLDFYETDSVLIYVAQGIPEEPVLAHHPVRTDSTCYYSILLRLKKYLSSFEYSPDNGLNWQPIQISRDDPDDYVDIGRFRPDTTVNLLVRGKNACGYSIPVSLTTSIPPPQPGCTWPLGFDEQETAGLLRHSGNFALYPNPATEVIRIFVDRIVNDPIREDSFRITDLTGRLMMEGTLRFKETEIRIGSLQPGFYLVMLEVKGEPVRTEKLLKL